MLNKITVPGVFAGVMLLGGIFLFTLDSAYLTVMKQAAASKREGGSVFANFGCWVASITSRFPVFSHTSGQPQVAPSAPETLGEVYEVSTLNLNTHMVGVGTRI